MRLLGNSKMGKARRKLDHPGRAKKILKKGLLEGKGELLVLSP